MKICHVCKSKCEDFEELCRVCGADLVAPKEIIAEQTPDTKSVELSLLASFDDIVSAEIFKDILSDNGVEYVCPKSEQEETLNVTFGGSFSVCEIYVYESDLELASTLYSEFTASPIDFDGEFIFDEGIEEE